MVKEKGVKPSEQEKIAITMSARNWKVNPWAVCKGDRIAVTLLDASVKWLDVANLTIEGEPGVGRVTAMVPGEERGHWLRVVADSEGAVSSGDSFAWEAVTGHLRASEIVNVPGAQPVEVVEGEAQTEPPPPAQEKKKRTRGKKAAEVAVQVEGESGSVEQKAEGAAADGAIRVSVTEDSGQVTLPTHTLDDAREQYKRAVRSWNNALSKLEGFEERIASLREKAKPAKKKANDTRLVVRMKEATLRKVCEALGVDPASEGLGGEEGDE